MTTNLLTCDTVIAGGGIAGLTCALELVRQDQKVIVVDRDTPDKIGGLARLAFGGMALCGTPQQKFMHIPDSPNQLLDDWHSFAEFNADDSWPQQWADEYAKRNYHDVYLWLKSLGLRFLPAVNWVERGLYTPGNSLPRYHILWGTGWELVEVVLAKLAPFIQSGQLNILHQHKALAPITSNKVTVGLSVENELNQRQCDINAKNVVIACGGINGSEIQVRKNCTTPNTKLPLTFLNGANPISNGLLHDTIEQLGAKVTHKDKMWNYAAGVHHPQAEFDGHGLSLIPCKSALWLNHLGKRIGPQPLVTGFDTHELCQQVAEQEKPWTWQVLNWDIAIKELAVSGSLHNPSIKNKNFFQFFKEIFFGNHRLVSQLAQECDDFICADSIEELADKMNRITDAPYIETSVLKHEIEQYDQRILTGKALENDDQIRRIHHARQWRPDRLRTCKPAPIISGKKRQKLIAIKLQLVTRKSLGGIQTNLQSQVLDKHGQPMPSLYCIGEAAGFGGGGSNGKRSLEGTFLSGCILTARNAAKAILLNNNKREA